MSRQRTFHLLFATFLLGCATFTFSQSNITTSASEVGTLFVSPNSQCNTSACYSAIQDAIDAASDGDIIKIAAGSYKGSAESVISLEKSITLQGGYLETDWSTADPRANPTIIEASNNSEHGIFINVPPPQEVTIDGLIIQNATGTGISMYRGQGIVNISNSIIRDNLEGVRGGAGFVNISDSIVENNKSFGLVWADCCYSHYRGIHAENNIIRNNEYGIFIVSLGNYEETPVSVIKKNKIVDNNDTAIFISRASQKIEVLNNDIERNLCGIEIFANIADIDLFGNLIKNNGGGICGGIRVSFNNGNTNINRNTIVRNTASDGLGHGLKIIDSEGLVSGFNNIVANNDLTGAGIYAHNARIYGTHWTVAASGAVGLMTESEGYEIGEIILTNSIIANHPESALSGKLAQFDSVVLLHGNGENCINGAFCGGSDMELGDPSFVNPDADDFHISYDSLALNRSKPDVSNTNEDIDSNPRPVCGGFDLGADEFEGAPAINNLTLNRVGSDFLLEWNVPRGMIDTQLIQYSYELISDENWSDATPITTVSSGEQSYTATIPDYVEGETIYFAIRTIGDCGTSAVSLNAFWPNYPLYLPMLNQ